MTSLKEKEVSRHLSKGLYHGLTIKNGYNVLSWSHRTKKAGEFDPSKPSLPSLLFVFRGKGLVLLLHSCFWPYPQILDWSENKELPHTAIYKIGIQKSQSEIGRDNQT